MDAAATISADVKSSQRFISGGAGKIYFRSVLPSGAAWARIGMLHGYGDHCGRYEHFYRWMAERGVACCAMDFRGHGRSEGKRGFVVKWDEYLEDLEVFLGQPELSARESPPVFLVGHSHGGLVLAEAGIRGLRGVAGAVFSCPYFKSAVPVPWWKGALSRVANRCWPSIRVLNGLRPEWLCCDAEMIEDSKRDVLGHRIATPRWFETMQVAQVSALERAGEFKLPMLMVIGKKDCIAVPQMGERFFETAGSAQKKILVYPEMLHEVLREKGREGIFEEIVGWMRRIESLSH